MVTIHITGFLTDFTGGRRELKIDSAPATVREALDKLWGLHVGLRDRVINERGELRPHVNIFLDSENIRRKQLLDTEVSNGSEITILPSVSGGGTEMKAVWNNATVAESDQTVVVEGNHYFPPQSVNRQYLQESSKHSTCPWKGEASYYDVVVDGQVNKEAAWYYPQPKPAAAEIKDHVAFWRGIEVK